MSDAIDSCLFLVCLATEAYCTASCCRTSPSGMGDWLRILNAQVLFEVVGAPGQAEREQKR